MSKKIIIIFLLFLSFISFGEEFKGSYEEGYIEINVNRKINYSFFPIYMDYEMEEPYIGLMNFFSLIMANGMEIDRESQIIKGKMGEEDYIFDYKNTKYINKENDVYIRSQDFIKIFNLKEYNWNTETYILSFRTEFLTPYEIYLERNERVAQIEGDDIENISEEDIYIQKRRLFTPGVLKPRYTNNDVENDDGFFSLRYDTQLLYGDFTTTGFIYPDSYLGYTSLTYNEVLENKSIILGDSFMQTYDFLGSKRLTGISIQDWNNTTDIEVGKTTIRGFAPFNSDVELYRNGILYRFLRVEEDGSYIFENINIQNYSDIYTIKIYNFDGSIETKQVSMLSDRNILTKGEFDYNLLLGTYRKSGNDDGERIVLEEKSVEGNISLAYGITNHLTIGFEYINDLTEETIGEDTFAIPTEMVGLNLYYTTGAVKYPTYFEFSEVFDLENDLDNLNTHIGIIRQRFGSSVLSLEAYLYSDFVALLQGYENRYVVDWRSPINNMWGYSLTYDNIDNFGQIEQYGSGTLYRNTYKTSHEIGITYPFEERDGNPTGYYSYSRGEIPFMKTNLNFILQISTDFKEPEENTEFRVGLRSSENKDLKGGIYLSYDLENNYEISLEVTYRLFNWFEIFGSIVNTEDTTSHLIGVDIEKTIILERPLTKNTNPPPSNSWIEGKIFMDDNDNGVYDEGEKLLEGVEVSVGRKKSITEEEGEYFIDDISPYEVDKFDINIETLDPMVEAANEKRYIKLYPATGKTIDIPIQSISVIMGDVRIDNGEISGVEYFPILSQLYIQLKDLDGNIKLEQRIEPEGFYMLDKVLPGNYILEMEYKGDKDIKFKEKSKKIEIKKDEYGNYYEGYNFEIISY